MNSQNEIISKFAEGPDRLEQAIAGLSDPDFDVALNDDSWTIRQIIHHLADGDELWRIFIKQAIGNPGSKFTLEWYWQMSQEEWAEHWSYRERAVDLSLALYRVGRQSIVQLLEQSPETWEKTLKIQWPNREGQEVSVGWVVEMQIHHLEGHLEDIRKIIETR